MIPVYGALELVERCLRSVLRHTDAAVVIADDATPGEAVERLIEALSGERPVAHLRQERNVGFPLNVNAALAAAAPADVALVNSDCEVAAGWLDGLRAAALSDSRIATASALSNNGSILSVPRRNRPSPPPPGRSLDEVAAAVRAASPRRRPRIPTAIGHCFYVRRAALELAGALDASFSPGYGEEVDFSQRCVRRGLIHVAADDVYVNHDGEGSFGADAADTRERHERVIRSRYPYYHRWVEEVASSRRGPLADSLAAARRALGGMSVTIDASALGPVAMGTQVTILALIEALAGRVRLRVVVPRTIRPAARERIAALETELVHVDEVDGRVEPTDVVHRPSQLTEPKQLAWLERLGDRVVITQQDLIAYANPAYFASAAEHGEHRALTRDALAIADRIVFISDFVRAEAQSQELVGPARATVVAQGVDHDLSPAEAVEGLGGGPFVLCLGTDFMHKNRAFAIRVFDEMVRGGYAGRLVLAGPRIEHGSSRAEEDDLLTERVDRLDEVSDGARTWLYENAQLVLYPTVSEGFGLVPFEAARAGTACMFAPETALAEVCGVENATLVAWDAEASARNALELIADEARRAALLDNLRRRGEPLTWRATADRLLETFEAVAREPANAARAAYFGEAVSGTAMALVGPGGYLTGDEQRALLAVAARPPLRRALLEPLAAAYRLVRRLT